MYTSNVRIVLMCLLATSVNSIPQSEDATDSTPIIGSITGANDPTSITGAQTFVGGMSGQKRLTRRERRKELFDHMVRELGDHDTIKMTQLTTAPESYYREMNRCFLTSCDTFSRFCHFDYLAGGTKYFKLLLSVACDAKWLTTEKICRIVSYACHPRLFGRRYF